MSEFVQLIFSGRAACVSPGPSKGTMNGFDAQAKRYSGLARGWVRTYQNRVYERPIVWGAGPCRFIIVAPAIGAAIELEIVLPSGFTLDTVSFRSLGGSPASAGLPHFRNR
jgi:hypothetical protein